jgi:CRP-like cAMP-binding protein
MKAFPAGKTGNRLLNLLPSSEYDRLKAHLQKVELKQAQVLYEARSTIEQVFFPLNSVLSAVAVMRSGDAIEVATVGNEGVSGLPALSVVATSPNRVFTQIAGDALQADAAIFNRESKQLPKLAETMTSYQQAFLFQVSQSVACNGLHAISPRCCRWLLMTHDRVEGDDLTLTHEFLSYMLGCRRSGVTEVLQSLQEQGLIRYGKGNITVVDRERLEKSTCECYQDIRDEYNRLLN